MAVAVINGLLSVVLVIVVAWAVWLIEKMPLVPNEFKQIFILVLIIVLLVALLGLIL